jgi:hypothetical protein
MDLQWAHPQHPKGMKQIRDTVNNDYQQCRTASECTRITLFSIDIEARAESVIKGTGKGMVYTPLEKEILEKTPAAIDEYVRDVIRLDRRTNRSRHHGRGSRQKE